MRDGEHTRGSDTEAVEDSVPSAASVSSSPSRNNLNLTLPDHEPEFSWKRLDFYSKQMLIRDEHRETGKFSSADGIRKLMEDDGWAVLDGVRTDVHPIVEPGGAVAFRYWRGYRLFEEVRIFGSMAERVWVLRRAT